MSLRHWLQLALTDGIGPILTQRLIDTAGSAEQACNGNLKLLQQIDGIGSTRAQRVADSLKEAAREVDRELERAANLHLRLICRDDADYPSLLQSIPDPPSILYVRGTLEPRDLNALAIVGTRRCSHYGREQAERFAALLAGSGMTVASGGARGIDSAAHRGALSHPQGRTIAVLGCGLDSVYPPENKSLFDQIAERGAIVSEYPIGTPPLAENFPRRNRVVSGMSRGVLVIEADARSGALITARQACDDHGRPVFAVPGRVDNVMSAGPHLLIRDGAVLTRSIEDILEGLDPLPEHALRESQFENREAQATGESNAAVDAPPVVPSALEESQQRILAELDGDTLTADALIERTNLPAPEVMRQLTMLSLRGLVRRVDGQTYSSRKIR